MYLSYVQIRAHIYWLKYVHDIVLGRDYDFPFLFEIYFDGFESSMDDKMLQNEAAAAARNNLLNLKILHSSLSKNNVSEHIFMFKITS